MGNDRRARRNREFDVGRGTGMREAVVRPTSWSEDLGRARWRARDGQRHEAQRQERASGEECNPFHASFSLEVFARSH